MGKKILIVDDEKPILSAFQRSLRGSGLEIFTAEDSSAALAIVNAITIDIIITDMRMPNMTGHQLLRKIKNVSPATTRLILSGHTEETEVIRAMMDGSCQMYLLKPWDTQALLTLIRKLLDVREMLQEKKLLEFINKIDDLCSAPTVYNEIMNLINKDADMQQIAKVIERDPIVSAKVLHMVNSSFFRIKTGSVSQAITYLGLTAIKNIVLSTSVCELIPSHQSGHINKDLILRHSSVMNKLVNYLHYKLLGKNIHHSASSIGLLCGIGLMALVHKMPQIYSEISAQLLLNPKLSFIQLERAMLGVSHDIVGAYLLDWWELPQPIIESTMFHHDPFNENVVDKQLVSIVHIADYYALKALVPNANELLDERALSLFNISEKDCERLISESVCE